MKKTHIFMAIALLLSAFFSACSDGGASSTTSTPQQPASQSVVDSSVSQPTPSTSLPVEPVINERDATQLPPIYAEPSMEINWNDFFVRNNYDFRPMFAAVDDTLYFHISNRNEEGMGIGMYDEQSRVAELIDFYHFNIGGDDMLIVDNQYMFIAPITYGADIGKQMMQLMMFDIERKTHRIVYEHQIRYLSNSIERISEDEILLYFDGVEQNEEEEVLVQKIVKYNFVLDTSTEIFRHQAPVGEDSFYQGKMPWYMTVADGKIYLLLYENDGESLKPYIQELSEDGQLLKETPVEILSDYGDLNANTLFTANGCFFFYYYYSGEGMDAIAIARETENSLERIRFSGQSPVVLMRDGLVENRYAFYVLAPNNNDYKQFKYDNKVFVFDTLTCTYWYVDLKINEPLNIGQYHVNEDGDIFYAPGDGDLPVLKFSAENILVYE